MDQEIPNIENKSKILNFWTKNKKKIIFGILFVIVLIILIIFFDIKKEKDNDLVSEKFLLAGIEYSKKNEDKAHALYEEVISSKNKFYSILALNMVLEKNLTKDGNKILNYFEEVEKLNIPKEKKDILLFKKALYLLKNSKTAESKKILNELIENDSSLKTLSEEILKD